MAVVYQKERRRRSTDVSDRLLLALYGVHAGRGEICTIETEVGQTGRRIDFWSMMPSWSDPCPTGYEVKISMADFQRDTKWESYLPYCERFSFCCPKGLLRPTLLPPGIGLVEVDEEGMVSVVVRSRRHPLAEDKKNEMMQRLLFRYVFNKGELMQPHWTLKQLAKMEGRS